MNIAKSGQTPYGQHDDAYCATEVAAIDADQELEDEDEDDPGGGRILVRAGDDAEAARDHFLHREQECRAEDEKGHQAGEGLRRRVHQQH